MKKQLWPEFVKALKADVAPALGCTEPISLALACAIATRELGRKPDQIEARVSPNLLKNGMGVTVPGTGMTGLPIAAAVGALGGNPDGKLEVLKGLTTEIVSAGKKMLADKKVSVGTADVPNILYSEARVSQGDDWVRVAIADGHTNVILIEKNGKELFKSSPSSANQENHGYSIEGALLRDVYDFATEAPFDMIEFILDAGMINDALSREGMKNTYGLHIGQTLQRQIDAGLMSKDLMTDILVRSSAASDARMGGATLPAMSNSGSGNQGIAATMPVVVVAEHVGADRETLARALIMAHLAAIYIHNKLPPLSALCAVTTATMGSATAVAWLLKGGYEAGAMAICNMIGDVAGVVCDGASNSCAMKVSTSAMSCYKSVLLALDRSRVCGNEGIVCDDVDQSICNLCALACGSMMHTDKQIIDLMLAKTS